MLHHVVLPVVRRSLAGLALAALASAALTPPAHAQASVPKTGDWFQESANLGFRVRSPKDWRYIPPQPNERFTVAKYVPTGRNFVPLKGTAQLFVEGFVTCFDVPTLKADLEKEFYGMFEVPKGVTVEMSPEYREFLDERLNIDWMITYWLAMSQGQGSDWKLVEKTETKSGKTSIEERIYEGKFRWPQATGVVEVFPVRVYVAMLPISDERWGAIAFNGPGEDKLWKPHENGFRRFGRTLQTTGATSAAAEVTGDPREDRRAELAVRIKQMPGWWMHETPNYFIITDSKDKKFIDELAGRLEAIRAVYEVDYPFTKARRTEVEKRIRIDVLSGPDAPKPEAADTDDEDEEEEEAEEDDPNRTASTVDSYQRSRASVVRVCSDREMYHEYGGPYGSAGYWYHVTEELVLYDDKQVGGRTNTWAVVNHEAFHQYIYYFYGNISPHSWYNEGTGDFYSGYQYNPRSKKFTLTPFDWRRGLARETIRSKKYAPLREWLRWSQPEYYGNNDYGLEGGENYALGWSFVWFLRTGKGKSKAWNRRWDTILDTYLETLGATGDLEKALDAAFEGVDFAELERAWTAYTQ